MLRRRILPFAALALAVPVPALALSTGGSEGDAATPALSVSASLDSCGVADTAIVCKIDAAWGSVEGVDYYTASVTRADGSVVDYGQVGSSTGTSLWVPYVGAGTYTVQVSAYGTPPGEEKAKLVAKDTASASEGAVENRGRGSAGARHGGAEHGFGERPRGGDAVVDEPPPPDCETTDPEKPADGTEPGPEAGIVDQAAAKLGKLPDAATAALAAEAELPESVDCPAPSE